LQIVGTENGLERDGKGNHDRVDSQEKIPKMPRKISAVRIVDALYKQDQSHGNEKTEIDAIRKFGRVGNSKDTECDKVDNVNEKGEDNKFNEQAMCLPFLFAIL